ncbi:NOPCHAP1/New4 family protein, partial [Klebsiella pneumoniae]|nr:NOPCHAP1/New4 family protein [Klebsiella pneumoniae]
PGLLSKLSAFLPQMKTANEDLQREIAAGRAKDIRLDEDDENEAQSDGQYIEMVCSLLRFQLYSNYSKLLISAVYRT